MRGAPEVTDQQLFAIAERTFVNLASTSFVVSRNCGEHFSVELPLMVAYTLLKCECGFNASKTSKLCKGNPCPVQVKDINGVLSKKEINVVEEKLESIVTPGCKTISGKDAKTLVWKQLPVLAIRIDIDCGEGRIERFICPYYKSNEAKVRQPRKFK